MRPSGVHRLNKRTAGSKSSGYANWRFPVQLKKAALEKSARRVHSGKGPLSTTGWAISNEARCVLRSFARYLKTGATFRRRNRRRVRLGISPF